MILAATGHRPDKLNNEYNCDGPCTLYLRQQFCNIFEKYKPEKIISGMALGVDTVWALTAFSLNIPVIAAVPFEGQESIWPERSKQRYRMMIQHAAHVEYVCEPGYAPWKMQKRNEWMTDQADVLVAVWNGSKGGTANCVSYAEKINKNIELINPEGWKNEG